MTSPELPSENHKPEGVFAYDLYMDSLEDEMRTKRNEALDELEVAIGHAAAVASETWPNSIHSFNKSDGELLILSTQLEVTSIGRCLNFIVNDITYAGVFGKRQVDIYDFVVALRYRSAAYKRTAAQRNESGHTWDIQEHTGPVLIKRFDSVTQCYGNEYMLPTVKKIDIYKDPVVEVIDETIAAEQLVAWLCLISEVSYEPYTSRGI